LARSFFGPVVRPARGGVSGFASASRPKAAPQETQDRHGRRKGQAWDIGQPPPGQASDRHSSRVRSPFGHQTGLPMPRSPDVRGCLPGIRSLDADRASPSWLRLSSHAGSRGTGNPSTTTQSNPAATRPTSRGLEDRGSPVRATLGVARDGPSENGQDARVSRRQRAQNPAVWRTAVRPSGQPLALPATGQAKTGRMPVFRVYTENGQDARVSRVVRRSASADTRPRGGRGRGGRSPPAGRG
jgi:hypothetical protein